MNVNNACEINFAFEEHLLAAVSPCAIWFIYRYHLKVIYQVNLQHHIFMWLCAWDGCTIIFCRLLYINPAIAVRLFLLSPHSPWCLQIAGSKGPKVQRSYSLICSLRYLIIIICSVAWMYWKHGACQAKYVDCVSKIESILVAISNEICLLSVGAFLS